MQAGAGDDLYYGSQPAQAPPSSGSYPEASPSLQGLMGSLQACLTSHSCLGGQAALAGMPGPAPCCAAASSRFAMCDMGLTSTNTCHTLIPSNQLLYENIPSALNGCLVNNGPVISEGS